MVSPNDRSPDLLPDVEMFRDAVEAAPEAVYWMNGEGRFVYANERAHTSLGYTREELYGLRVWDIDPGLSPERWSDLWGLSTMGSTIDTAHRRKDGTLVPVEISAKDQGIGSGRLRVAFARDISERKRAEEEKKKLEAQLLHAQKLESIGRLAGGVAHDFNNMLTVILGYTELISRQLKAADPLKGQVQEIERAASRSRDITRQLLAFSRKQVIAPRPVDLNRLVAGAQNALSRLIGEDIDLRFVPGEGLPNVLFDPSQIEQMLFNLVVNARDATSAGGAILVETARVRVDEAHCRDHVEASPGEYVVLTVSDNGVGMDPQTLSHVFEPFFTTKETGKGTGLGLATVYGIIKQNSGFIDVSSEPGHGSAFKLYIPAMRGPTVEPSLTPYEVLATRGRGTILVVEDDEMVRNLTRAMLAELGYTVLVAPKPYVALSLCDDAEVRIDLVVSDVVMPEMNGPELRDRMRAVRPGLKVLLISGYTSDPAVRDEVMAGGDSFIEKPFTMSALAHGVRDALRSEQGIDGPPSVSARRSE